MGIPLCHGYSTLEKLSPSDCRKALEMMDKIEHDANAPNRDKIIRALEILIGEVYQPEVRTKLYRITSYNVCYTKLLRWY